MIYSMYFRSMVRGLPALLLLCVAAGSFLSGCYTITRTEEDLYTITQSDTTIREDVHNTPGERENGTIYPSPRTVTITREYVQRDSTVERHYPAFLRFGGIETASFLSGGTTDGSGNGLFGLYDLLTLNRTDDTKIFTANLYRIMPYEIRLRWFNDSPNWTIGTSAVEFLQRQRDSSAEFDSDEQLIGIAPIYLRKRYFLREDPPYIMVVPFFGVSPWGPNHYVNLGSTLDIGSIGGFNARAYVGYAAGITNLFTGLVDENGETSATGVAFPYVGIGVSALDFVNKTEELFIEWKDHDHNALEVSGMNFDLVRAFSDTRDPFATTLEDTTAGAPPISGLILRIASASIPVPVGDRRWFIGTSLFNLMALNGTDVAFGFLPIRTGYRFNLLEDELSLEPFAEFTYFPSTALHVGGRLVLEVPEIPEIGLEGFPFTMNLLFGMVSGSTNLDVLTGVEELAAPDSFTTPYIGFGIGVGDALFTPEEVMHKPLPPVR